MLRNFLGVYEVILNNNFCENLLKYVLLRLGPEYKPGSAAVYIEQLSSYIDELAYCERYSIGLRTGIGAFIGRHVIKILDSCEYLSREEKLSYIDWSMANSKKFALSLISRPCGTFEDVIRKERHVCVLRAGSEDDGLGGLANNENIKRFHHYLKEELHRIDYSRDLIKLDEIKARQQNGYR
jgi:hypothetical protein